MNRRLFLLALAIALPSFAQNRLLLLIGPPGAGKSTQANFLKQKYNMEVVSIDDLIAMDPASLSKNKNPKLTGIDAHSDPALNGIFEKRFAQIAPGRGLVLDGYPATKDHADFLSKFAREKNLPAPVVLQLDVPDDVVRKRSKAEKPAELEQRLKDYHREMDLIGIYFPNIKIYKLDGTQNLDKVSKSIAKVLDSSK
jgi:adenylate kinase